MLLDTWLRPIKGLRAWLLCFSSDGNFRKEIFPEYKANRKGMKRPEHLTAVKDHLSTQHKSLSIPRLEADDVIGIYATSGHFHKPVIVSTDKDLLSVPARHFNPDKKQKRRTNRFMADYVWMTQTLTGDVTDNYKGAKGVGEKRAERLLEPCSTLADMWEAVLGAFVDAGQSEEDAILNAQVARILRAENYDQDKETIHLWHPTKSVVLPTTSTAGASTPSTSPRNASGTCPETKLSTSEPSSNTSHGTGGSTRKTRRKTSEKHDSTSNGQSKRPNGTGRKKGRKKKTNRNTSGGS
nr:hypothetical protein [Marivibrio halodurans]